MTHGRPADQIHVRWLDTMRGLAACSVVLFHLNEPREFAWTWYQWIVKHGWLGVPCFFVISGLSVQLAAHRNPKMLDFLTKRFWRIYPPYIASVLICVGCIASLHFTTGHNDVAHLPGTLSSLVATALIATKPVTNVPPMNWVYWSLSYEVFFYCVIATGICLVQRYRWSFLIALSVIAFFFKVPDGTRLVYAWPLDQWCLFALGICLAEWQTRRHPAALVVAILASGDLIFNRPTSVAIVGLLTFITAAISLSKNGRVLNSERLLSSCGIWSYGLYLIHVPIGCWLLLRFTHRFAQQSLLLHIAGDAIILSILIFFSYLFYHSVERRSKQIGTALIFRARSTALRAAKTAV